MKLYSRRNIALDVNHQRSAFVTLITTNANLFEASRPSSALLITASINTIPIGFGLVLLRSDVQGIPDSLPVDVVQLSEELDYLDEGDIIKFDPASLSVDVLFRKNANTNSFLVTERCNSYCLMCSQPPRDIDDSYRISDYLDAIPLINESAHEILISGGEPTLLGEDFFRLLYSLKRNLPNTAVHVLSNGRNFQDAELARKVASVGHFDLMIGIPLYSDISAIHDFVVQADNAYDETIRGIINLKSHNVRVEIRVVIHLQTYKRLPQLANFIARNLLFVDHVALMGLEIMGFTRANLDALWIDPTEFSQELEAAAETLDRAGIRTSIYNLPLCLLPKNLWKFSVKSISDWKNEYVEECDSCTVKSECGGFFESSRHKRSKNIRAIL